MEKIEYKGFIIILEGGGEYWAHQILLENNIVDNYCLVHAGRFSALECAINKIEREYTS